MSTAEIKLDLIAWLSTLEDKQALDEIAQIKKQFVQENYERSLKSMSLEELKESLLEAESDYVNGRIISQDELEKRIKEGKVL